MPGFKPGFKSGPVLSLGSVLRFLSRLSQPLRSSSKSLQQQRAFKRGSIQRATTVLALVVTICLSSQAQVTVHCPPMGGDNVEKVEDLNGDGTLDWHYLDTDTPDGTGGTYEVWCLDRVSGSYFVLLHRSMFGLKRYAGHSPHANGNISCVLTRDQSEIIYANFWSVSVSDPEQSYDDYRNYYDPLAGTLEVRIRNVFCQLYFVFSGCTGGGTPSEFMTTMEPENL